MSEKKNEGGMGTLIKIMDSTNENESQNESEGDKKEGEVAINEGGKSDPPLKKTKYLQLNITDYQDYISLMAEHEKDVTGKYVSMTKYILQLIEADKQKNIELYTKLENIEKMKKEII